MEAATEPRTELTGLTPLLPGEPSEPSTSTTNPTSSPPSAVDRVPLSRIQHRERLELWRASGIPKLHRLKAETSDLDDWPIPSAIHAANEAVFGQRGLLGLVGRRGPGKTQLAACIAWAGCMAHGWSVMYRRAADLLSEIKHECFELGGSDAKIVRKLSRVGLLIIDECQERWNSETEDLFLHRILDHRYGEKVPTILIANLHPDGFAAALGPSIISRMTECGAIVECTWGSFRRPPGVAVVTNRG